MLEKDRLWKRSGIDYVVHAAAIKIVQNLNMIHLCVKTNVYGAMNLIDICIDRGVKKVVSLSTDMHVAHQIFMEQQN